jgi:hypothetical protein
VGWQPSRFLTARTEAEHAFALAEQLGSINAAAQELGTTWPSLRKAFTRHGLGMPARNPEAVRQRAIAAARQRSGRPVTPSLDPVFVALNHGELPIRARSGGELAERVRRAEDYAALGAEVVVELHSESHAARPSTRAWAITRSAQRAHRLGNATAGATHPALLGGYENYQRAWTTVPLCSVQTLVLALHSTRPGSARKTSGQPSAGSDDRARRQCSTGPAGDS